MAGIWRRVTFGGENGAVARAVPPSATAVKVCCPAGTGTQGLPSEYCTWSASGLPAPSRSFANGTSRARLNKRTADPVFGGVNDAAMASTAVGLVGGHAPLITITSGPGVKGMVAVSSAVPEPCSLTSIVPVPPWKIDVHGENCEKR